MPNVLYILKISFLIVLTFQSVIWWSSRSGFLYQHHPSPKSMTSYTTNNVYNAYFFFFKAGLVKKGKQWRIGLSIYVMHPVVFLVCHAIKSLTPTNILFSFILDHLVAYFIFLKKNYLRLLAFINDNYKHLIHTKYIIKF